MQWVVLIAVGTVIVALGIALAPFILPALGALLALAVVLGAAALGAWLVFRAAEHSQRLPAALAALPGFARRVARVGTHTFAAEFRDLWSMRAIGPIVAVGWALAMLGFGVVLPAVFVYVIGTA